MLKLNGPNSKIPRIPGFGRKEHRNTVWYKTHWTEMQPVSEAKRNILLENKQNHCPSTCDALRAAQNKTQQTAFQCAEAHL